MTPPKLTAAMPARVLRHLLAACLAATALGAHAADALGEANKRVVLAFYEAALVRFDAEAARSHLGARYIQHNPNAPDGVEGVMGLIAFLREKQPQRSSRIHRVMADGDLVMLHVHAQANPGERGMAIVDIFRLENGKIVEHWDVMQPVPEVAKNNNTMF